MKLCNAMLQFELLNTRTFLLDNDNDAGSDDSDDKLGEVRFVPEDKSACKIPKFNLHIIKLFSFKTAKKGLAQSRFSINFLFSFTCHQ